jgi:hypothetical protein
MPASATPLATTNTLHVSSTTATIFVVMLASRTGLPSSPGMLMAVARSRTVAPQVWDVCPCIDLADET